MMDENVNDIISEFAINAISFRESNSDCKISLNVPYNKSGMSIDTFEIKNMQETKQEEREYVVMFVHGGKWQSWDKSTFAHCANGLIQHNTNVMMPEYSKCPEATIVEIINEMRSACLWGYQKYNKKIVVVGHEAGAHLAAVMFATQWSEVSPELPDDLVVAGLGITGIYNLNDIPNSDDNKIINLKNDEVDVVSPVKWLPQGAQKFVAVVGSEDEDNQKQQSMELAKIWSILGTPTEYLLIEGQSQYSIVADLQNEHSEIVSKIIELVNEPNVEF